jgi:DNA-binding Lrp family transcriptional regulator
MASAIATLLFMIGREYAPLLGEALIKIRRILTMDDIIIFIYRRLMKQIGQLDMIDRKIVRELQRDASLSHAALAEKVGASAASVWRRVRALEKSGVLGKTVRLADPEALDRSVNVLCQVRMHRQSTDARAEFEQFIQSRDEIVECYAMSGECDYLLRIAVRDVADYDRFIRQGVLAHPSVANAASNFALRQVKYTTEIPV